MSAPLEMNPVIRDLWTAALRSGEYPQGRGKLRDEKGAACCMGVLCDLAARHGILIPSLCPGVGWWVYDGYSDFLPQSVQDWAGLSDDNPSVLADFGEGLEAAQLSDLNDDYRWTFTQIADAIDGTEPAVTP